jgi:hypothetical protein
MPEFDPIGTEFDPNVPPVVADAHGLEYLSKLKDGKKVLDLFAGIEGAEAHPQVSEAQEKLRKNLAQYRDYKVARGEPLFSFEPEATARKNMMNDDKLARFAKKLTLSDESSFPSILEERGKTADFTRKSRFMRDKGRFRESYITDIMLRESGYSEEEIRTGAAEPHMRKKLNAKEDGTETTFAAFKRWGLTKTNEFDRVLGLEESAKSAVSAAFTGNIGPVSGLASFEEAMATKHPNMTNSERTAHRAIFSHRRAQMDKNFGGNLPLAQKIYNTAAEDDGLDMIEGRGTFKNYGEAAKEMSKLSEEDLNKTMFLLAEISKNHGEDVDAWMGSLFGKRMKRGGVNTLEASGESNMYKNLRDGRDLFRGAAKSGKVLFISDKVKPNIDAIASEFLTLNTTPGAVQSGKPGDAPPEGLYGPLTPFFEGAIRLLDKDFKAPGFRQITDKEMSGLEGAFKRIEKEISLNSTLLNWRDGVAKIKGSNPVMETAFYGTAESLPEMLGYMSGAGLKLVFSAQTGRNMREYKLRNPNADFEDYLAPATAGAALYTVAGLGQLLTLGAAMRSTKSATRRLTRLVLLETAQETVQDLTFATTLEIYGAIDEDIKDFQMLPKGDWEVFDEGFGFSPTPQANDGEFLAAIKRTPMTMLAVAPLVIAGQGGRSALKYADGRVFEKALADAHMRHLYNIGPNHYANIREIEDIGGKLEYIKENNSEFLNGTKEIDLSETPHKAQITPQADGKFSVSNGVDTLTAWSPEEAAQAVLQLDPSVGKTQTWVPEVSTEQARITELEAKGRTEAEQTELDTLQAEEVVGAGAAPVAAQAAPVVGPHTDTDGFVWQGSQSDSISDVYALGQRNASIRTDKDGGNNFGMFFSSSQVEASHYRDQGKTQSEKAVNKGTLRKIRITGNFLDLTGVEGSFGSDIIAHIEDELGVDTGLDRSDFELAQPWEVFKEGDTDLRERLTEAGYDGVSFLELNNSGSSKTVSTAVFSPDNIQIVGAPAPTQAAPKTARQTRIAELESKEATEAEQTELTELRAEKAVDAEMPTIIDLQMDPLFQKTQAYHSSLVPNFVPTGDWAKGRDRRKEGFPPLAPRGKSKASWLARKYYGLQMWASQRDVPSKTIQKTLDVLKAQLEGVEAQFNELALALNNRVKSYVKTQPKSTRESTYTRVQSDAYYAIHGGDKGAAAMKRLPKTVRAIVQKARKSIDLYSKILVDAEVFNKDLSEIIGDNMGAYITRKYRAHDPDANWTYESVFDQHPDKFNAALTEIMTERKLSEADAKDVMRTMLSKTDGREFLAGTKSAGKIDVSRLIKRKDLSPAILEFLGEIRDPGQNIATTGAEVARMAIIAEAQAHMAEQMVSAEVASTEENIKKGHTMWLGMERVPVPIIDPVTGEKSMISIKRTSKKFAGFGKIFVEPQFGNALAEYFQPHNGKDSAVEAFFNNVVTPATILGKYLQVVINPVSALPTNAMGGFMTEVFSGRFLSLDAKGVRAYFKSGSLRNIGKNPKEPYGVDDQNSYYKKTNKEVLAEGGVNSLSRNLLNTELEILGARNSSLVTSDLRASIERVASKKLSEYWAVRGPTRLYQAPDNAIKRSAFVHELDKWMRAEPDESFEEAVKKAGAEVLGTTQNYGMVNKMVKAFSQRSLFVGTYVSYGFEFYRNIANTVKLTGKELASGNLVRQQAGAKRVAGMAITGFLLRAMGTSLSQFWSGLTEEEREIVKAKRPPWMEHSEMVYVGGDKDSLAYLDAQYMVPYQVLYNGAMQLARGETFADKAIGATLALINPVNDRNILFQLSAEVLTNSSEKGPIYNDEAIDKYSGEWFEANAAHIGKGAFTPGLMKSYQKFQKAEEGDIGYGGGVHTFDDMMLGLVGARVFRHDINSDKYVQDNMNQFAPRWRTLSSHISKKAQAKREKEDKVEGRVGDEREADKAVKRVEEKRLAMTAEFMAQVGALKATNVTDARIRTAAKAAKVPKDMKAEMETFLKNYQKD